MFQPLDGADIGPVAAEDFTANFALVSVFAQDARQLCAAARRDAVEQLGTVDADAGEGKARFAFIRNREVGLQRYSAGLLANPMLQFEMSLFPLKTIGDYLWDTESYSPEKSWESGIIQLVEDEKSRIALRSFMRCSMASNVGGDPAPDLRQVFRRGVTAWRAGELRNAGDEFINEGNRMHANAKFLGSTDFKYPEIYSEIEPWIGKYLLGADALIALGKALHKCTFSQSERRIQGNAEIIKELEVAVDNYCGSRKIMFGDQIDGPINELIAELSA